MAMGADKTWKSIPLADHAATLPQCNIPDSVDHASIAKDALLKLRKLDLNDLAGNAIWRDSLAFTGTFRTFYGCEKVLSSWEELSNRPRPDEFQIEAGSSMVLRLGPDTSWIQASFSFQTYGDQPGRCSGTIGISSAEVSGESDWKIWLLCTVLEQHEGLPNVDRLEPGPATFPDHILKNGGQKNAAAVPIDCLVVGAGIGGLSMAARLKALQLSYLVVEKDEEVGDLWSKRRYDSVRLHTSKQYNQLPGKPQTFGKGCPYLLTAKDLADGFKAYVDMFGLNVITSTCLEKAEFDADGKMWHAKLRRNEQDLKINAKHIVLAIGDMGHKPNLPQYSDPHIYRGTTLHAVEWKNAKPWHGKRGVVIGSANSAHDIISDMANQDFETITLIQRSETFVLPGSTFSALVDPVYNDDTPTEVSDRALMSIPLSIQRLEAMAGIRACADLNPTKFDMMEARGFKTRRYGDLWGQLYDSQGKHFFDIGAGDLIANGRVKVRSDALPVAYTETGLLLGDGSRIDADVVAFATGYESNFNSSIKNIFGDDVSRQLRPFWGLDAEGEIFGAWKQTGRKYRHCPFS